MLNSSEESILQLGLIHKALKGQMEKIYVIKHVKLFFLIGLLIGSWIVIEPLPILSQDELRPCCLTAEPADIILYNATIITLNNQMSIAQAMAIKGEKILAVGTNDFIFQNYILEPGSRLITLENQTILPGIVDGHTHILQWTFHNNWTLSEAQELLLSYGYTTVVEKAARNDDMDSFLLAEQNDELRVRVNVFPQYNEAFLDENSTQIILESWYPQNSSILTRDRMLRVPGIKIYVDGLFQEGRGAWAVTIPYTTEDLNTWLLGITENPYGDLYWTQEELNQTVKAAQDAGFRVSMHAMGDRAIDTALNAIEYAIGDQSNSYYRHQIEHNSYLRPDQITRSKALDTLHSVRGYFPTHIQGLYRETFNETYEWCANRYSLPSQGIHTYLETDFSWHGLDDVSATSHINPFLHLWGLVTKSMIFNNGTIVRPEPWLEQHTLSVEQALKTMTIEGAFAVSQEQYIGSLGPNKFADLMILPDSPLDIHPDALKDLEVLVTMVGGQIEYIKDSFNLNETIITNSTTSSSSSSTGMVIPTPGLTWILVILPIIGIIGIRQRKKRRM